MTPQLATDRQTARGVADCIAHHLATPNAAAAPWTAQSLTTGAAGTALLHITRAQTGIGGWDTARAWLADTARTDLVATPQAGLFLGAPAVAFALHTAAAGTGRYRQALSTLDPAVTTLAHRRLDHAYQRLARRQRPRMAEYDLINGLTGIGAHLLLHRPGDDATGRILTYLVKLTEPLPSGDDVLPGWWTDQDPHARVSAAFPGGHGNLGIAHGITGPLALLALAARHGITVDRHTEAIVRICAWLDTWRHDHDGATWWPQWVTRSEQLAHHAHRPGPGRPSWCYGTPGIARAQQLAGIATGDHHRRKVAEQALAACLADPDQLDRIVDAGLCHGWSGLYQTAWRAARDAATPAIAGHLPHLANRLLHHTQTMPPGGPGFLDGAAGTALALHTATDPDTTTCGWDACLLLT